MTETVVQARKLETRPGKEMPIPAAQVWIDEPIWPRSSRVAFVLAAAMAGATLQDPAFDLAAAIQHVFAEGLATAYCLSPEEEAPQ